MLQAGMVCQIDPETTNRKYGACFAIVKEKVDEVDVLCVVIRPGDRLSSLLEEVKIPYEDLEPVNGFPMWLPDEAFNEKIIKNSEPFECLGGEN